MLLLIFIIGGVLNFLGAVHRKPIYDILYVVLCFIGGAQLIIFHKEDSDLEFGSFLIGWGVLWGLIECFKMVDKKKNVSTATKHPVSPKEKKNRD